MRLTTNQRHALEPGSGLGVGTEPERLPPSVEALRGHPIVERHRGAASMVRVALPPAGVPLLDAAR
jgi:hypothetical protein